MKMIVLMASESQAQELKKTLQPAGFRMTQIASTGGFLRRGVETLLLGVEDHEVEEALSLVQTVVTQSGSALPYFILNVRRFERL